MRGHKYIKRTGGPGNYKYWYKLPDGSMSAGSEADQKRGKVEHVKRLLAGKRDGVHNMTHAEIAQQTGHPRQRVTSAASNMQTRGGHDFDSHHKLEATHDDVDSGTYIRKITTKHGPAAADHGTVAESRRARDRARSAPAEAAARGRRSAAGETLTPSVKEELRTALGGITEEQLLDEIRRVRERGGYSLREAIPVIRRNAGGIQARRNRESRAAARRAPAEAAATPRTPQVAEGAAGATPLGMARISPEEARREAQQAGSARETKAQKQARLIAELKESGIDLSDSPEGPAAVREAAERVGTTPAPAAAPPAEEGAAARDLSEADPALAEAETAVQAAVDAQRNGENPYLKRSKEIYERIKGELKPERAKAIKHMLAAYETRLRGGAINEAGWKAQYNAIRTEMGGTSSGLPPWSGAKKHFESGTFHTMDEVINNPPINLEVERMKRGYAAKQFHRLKPFLKDAWAQANPSAPPPMPTFGDLKSWSEVPGGKTPYAQSVNPRGRTALPDEVHKAVVKGADGKPKLPPPWMPIHLMPAWNYVVAKTGGAGSAYGGQRPQVDPSGKLSTTAQARYQEGIALSTLRKYVVMRGGPDQLIDIPSSKLAGSQLSHAQIFKADNLSDAQLKNILKTKVIDPVSFIGFLKKELKIKKSFSLVVSKSETYTPGETLGYNGDIRKSSPTQPGIVIDLKKAEKIRKIKGILHDRKVSQL